MAAKLFETRTRDESHAQLAAVLTAGTAPRAECREAIGDDGIGVYTVWDGPEPPFILAPAVPPLPPDLDDALVDRVLTKLLARLDARGKGEPP